MEKESVKKYECMDCGALFDNWDGIHKHFTTFNHKGWETIDTVQVNVTIGKKPESDEQAEQHLGAVTVDDPFDTYLATQQPSNKYDNGKPRLDLVPPGIIEAVGVVRTYGVSKYGDSESWKTVEPARYRAAMMRHLCAYLRDPASKDDESGISHLWHCACNLAFLIELEKGEKKDG